MSARHAARASLMLLHQRVTDLRAADDHLHHHSTDPAARSRQADAERAYRLALDEAGFACGVQLTDFDVHQTWTTPATADTTTASAPTPLEADR